MHLSPMSRSRQHRAAFGTTDRRPNLFSPSAVMSPGLRTGSTSRIARTAASLLTIAAVAFPIASAVALLDRLAAGASVVPPTAYVTNLGSSTVTPIATATNTPGTSDPRGIRAPRVAITPDGKTVYVANFGDDSVTPIATATNTPGTPITVGSNPDAIAITPERQDRLRLNLRRTAP